MGDLVRQLEKAFEWSGDAMLREAADEITALRARLAEVGADLAPTPPDPRVKALVDAVRHEREMVCQDMGMQMAASAAVDAALAAFDKDATP